MKKANVNLDIINLASLSQRFPDEKSCRKYLENIRWNGKIKCVHCKRSRKIYKINDGKLYKCADCKKQFTVKIGTIFEDSSVPLQKWFFAIFIITAHKKGISSLQLSKDIGVTQKTTWFMLHRIRYAVKTKSFNTPLENIVEADETYIGGKHPGKRGRGSENKTPVFGMIERGGEVRATPVKRVDSKTLKKIIKENISPEAIIMTDEWRSYRGLSNHKVINHGKKEYARGDIHVNNIENFWSLLKRGIIGVYHNVSAEHLHRYCDEFSFRHNTRESVDSNRFDLLLGRCEGRLDYNTLINNN